MTSKYLNLGYGSRFHPAWTNINFTKSGEVVIAVNYDWLLLEMYDQTVRNFSGGEMAHFLANLDENNRILVRSKIGDETENFWLLKQALPSGYRLNTLVSRITWGKRAQNFSREAGWCI